MSVRVLHVISSLDPATGGPAIALAGLAAALQCAGADVSVLTTYRQGEPDVLVRSMRALGVGVHVVGPTAPHGLRGHPGIQPALRSALRRTDVVHIHGLWEEVQYRAARMAADRGIPYIFRPCGMLDPWSLQQHRWKKRLYIALRLKKCLAGAAAIHFTTDSEREKASSHRYLPDSIVIPNGVTLDMGDDDASVEPGFDSPFLLYLGRLHHKKGLEFLLNALRMLNATGVALVICGSGSPMFESQLRVMVTERGLEGRVHFRPPVSGPAKYRLLEQAAMLVLTSRQENFGNVVAEALFAGTPVLVSDQVGLAGFVAEHGVGAVVPLDAEAIARAIREWHRRGFAAAELREHCRNTAREHFDWNRIAVRWIEEYSKLISAHSRRRDQR